MKDLAEKRAQQLREHTSHTNAGVYDPAGRRRHARDVRAARHRSSGAYGGLPKDPQVPLMVRIWKGPLKWLGNLAMAAGIIGVATHYIRYGPKKVEEQEDEGRAEMNAAATVTSTHPGAAKSNATPSASASCTGSPG